MVTIYFWNVCNMQTRKSKANECHVAACKEWIFINMLFPHVRSATGVNDFESLKKCSWMWVMNN